MMRLVPSLLLPRRHVATLVALLLAAQLSLFAHAIGHDYVQDADQSHVVCGLCIAAQHLDHGLVASSIALPDLESQRFEAPPLRLDTVLATPAAFHARAPPSTLLG